MTCIGCWREDPTSTALSSLRAPSPALDPEERWLLRRLVLQGFLVRAAVALLLHWTGYSGRFAPDEDTYASDGWSMALYWAGEVLVKPWRFNTDQPLGYFYINAVFFSAFGHSEIPVRLFNALLGAVCCRYVYFLARELFGADGARRAATLYAFFPSLVLWSALNIRDMWVIALILFISWRSLQVVRGYSHLALLSVVGATFLLTFFRDYLFYVVALPPVVAFLIGRRGRVERNFVIALLAGLAVVVLVQQGVVGASAHKHMSLESLSETRQNLATGGSAFYQEVDISTPGKALSFLPIGMAYFLFSPFPWQITSFLKVCSVPEMILIYGLAPAMFRGIRHAIQNRFRESLQVLLLTAFLTVSYSLGEGNVGTLYRHRAQAIVFYLMFAAAGLEVKRSFTLRRAAA